MRQPSAVGRTMLAVVLAIAATSCAPLPFNQGPNPDRAQGSSSDVITMAELRQLDPALSVMDAVAHARPWFLHPRGSASMVTIDHSPPTEPSILRTLSVADVKEIRLLRAATGTPPIAIRADGMTSVADVILVITATGRPER